MPIVIILTAITYLHDYVTSGMCDGVIVLVWGHFDHSSQARRAVGTDLNGHVSRQTAAKSYMYTV